MAGTLPPTPPSPHSPGPTRAASFAAGWDDYVDHAKAVGQVWPGDDWGDEALWNAWFERLLLRFGADRWEKVVEIGQGTGKYTRRALEAGTREILACDVSARFLDLCANRQAEFVDAGRLHLHQVSESEARAVQDACRQREWVGQVDALFSIDTLVHLPYSRTVAYLVAGRDVLKPGGTFACTFADGTNDAAHKKLLDDLDRVIAGLDNPHTGCFHWISPDLLAHTAVRLGYEVALCGPDPFHQRDGHFVARWRGEPTG